MTVLAAEARTIPKAVTTDEPLAEVEERIRADMAGSLAVCSTGQLLSGAQPLECVGDH